MKRAANAGAPRPFLESCVIDSEVTPGLNCQRQWLFAEVQAFRSELFPELEKLACQSSWLARGLIEQVSPWDTTSSRFGLAGRFVALLDDHECGGLSSLPEADKNRIRNLAKYEEEELRGQSGAGKLPDSAASPTPPPAIAPEPP